MDINDKKLMLPKKSSGMAKKTDNKHLSQVAKQNEEISEEIVLSIPCNVYWKNLKGEFLGCNRVVADIFHLKDPSEIIGKTNHDLFDKELATMADDSDNAVFKQGKTINVEEMGLNAAGDVVIYLTTRSPLYDKKSNIMGLLGVAQDITDKKQVEKLEKEAAQKVINFSNLVAGSIAHEMKNPLAGIKMQMEVLRDMDVNKTTPQTMWSLLKDITTSIIKTVDTTTYVIDGMLKKVRTFATGEAHHKEFEKLSIADDVEHLLRTYPFNNGQQNLVEVLYKTRFSYLGDKVLTAHVLGNLMKNALHAIGETCKDNATITLTTEAQKDFNLLIFRDTATGIPKDFLDKIFDQFETKKDVHGGTGLGLAFCKSVMKDSYGGDIACDTVEGEYTEFALKFPKME